MLKALVVTATINALREDGLDLTKELLDAAVAVNGEIDAVGEAALNVPLVDVFQTLLAAVDTLQTTPRLMLA
jgi:hypothetical protein